ncbi:MAG: hypothetical protein K1X83_05345 [Oligoflexia bacterium]|nr:hypothetical protein [Oligoflexia bacterium]
MRDQDIIDKAKELAQLHEKRSKDPRATRVLGFLKAKGLLLVDWIPARPSIKFNVVDALWVGENVEPRVLELLPAVVIHFPKTAINVNKLPKQLTEIVDQLKLQAPTGPSYQGFTYEMFKMWTEFKPKDKRVVPLSEKKVMRSFRLKRSVASKLTELAKREHLSEGEIIERFIQ